MKLSELKKIIERFESSPFSRHHEEDLEVVVETAQGGVPCRYMDPVKSATMGFDWTRGNFIIRTENPVVVFKQSNKSSAEEARERLQTLKNAYNELGQEYIKKAREEEWVNGFVEGYRKFTADIGEFNGSGCICECGHPKRGRI